LEQFADRSGVRSGVTFTGEIEYSHVPGELAKADIFATSSVSEVHPLTVIEAMAAGLPVVGAESPGISDLVENGVTGLLGQNREGAVAKRLLELAEKPERARRMGLAAAQASSQYRIQNTVSKTLELYERLLAERPDVDRQMVRRLKRSSARISSLRAYLPESIRSRTRRSRRYE
jgi:glycosyltransferase involved in cell wall biosynthesis